MTNTFKASANGNISSASFTAATLVARSDSTSDSPIMTVTGLDESSAPASTTIAMSGVSAAIGVDEFTLVRSVSLTSAAVGTVRLLVNNGTSAIGYIFVHGSPTAGDTIDVGLPGNVVTYTFVSALATPPNNYEVAIGASDTETAENLSSAINSDSAYTGLTAHPSLSATSSGTLVTMTDKARCARSESWVATATLTTTGSIVVVPPTGGADGTLLATINNGGTAANGAVTLEDEALPMVSGNMPGNLNWTSDPIKVSGKPFTIHLSASNVTTPMVATLEYSTQSSTFDATWRSAASLATPITIASLDNNSQAITPPLYAEHVRIKINNTNPAPASVNAKLVTW